MQAGLSREDTLPPTTERGNAGKTSVGDRRGPLTGRLTLTGSSTVAPLAAEIARRFEQLHPDVRVDVQTGGSSRGITDTSTGVADVGMASRWLKPDERTLVTHQIAVDGICLIAHTDNPVSSLTDEQVRSIYQGQITNWHDLSGRDSQIVVVNKAEGRGTLEVFQHYFNLDSAEIEADVIVGDNQQAIKTVAGNPQAIAYVSIGAADAEAGLGTPIRLLDAGRIAPTAENVRSGLFPITRPLLFLSRKKSSRLGDAFIQYAQTTAVVDLIEGLNFVPSNR